MFRKPPREAPIFAIRDDDTSFFTSVEELNSVYGVYWGRVPISLSIVPFSVPEHRGSRLGDKDSPSHPTSIEGNPELVMWLRERVRAGHIEPMLHGFTHEYRSVAGRWVGEFSWKPPIQMETEIRAGKDFLEALLGTKVKVFVPPSNSIGAAGVSALRRSHLNLSGSMGRGGDRPWSWDYPVAYWRRWRWRVLKGSGYPYPLKYGGHAELRANTLSPSSNTRELLHILEQCAKWGAPFVLATHYWEFKRDPSMRDSLAELVQRASSLGFHFGTVSDCFETE